MSPVRRITVTCVYSSRLQTFALLQRLVKMGPCPTLTLHPELSVLAPPEALEPMGASARTKAATIRVSFMKIPAQGSKSKLGTEKKPQMNLIRA